MEASARIDSIAVVPRGRVVVVVVVVGRTGVVVGRVVATRARHGREVNRRSLLRRQSVGERTAVSFGPIVDLLR